MTIHKMQVSLAIKTKMQVSLALSLIIILMPGQSLGPDRELGFNALKRSWGLPPRTRSRRGRKEFEVNDFFVNLKVAFVGDWDTAGTLPRPRPAKQNIYCKICFAFEDARSWKTDIYLRKNCCKVDAVRRR